MAIAVSGQINEWGAGKMLVTCTGGTSLVEINRDGTGFVPLSGGDVVLGIIPAESVFTADLKICEIRFTDDTGAPVVSYG